ncbi:hypothetical protein ACE3NQ_16440 [Paenibacillus terreus]|uniref:Nonstructural protein n=1 Tax=Paenibacillus terreus TaxID=1387834 RepID=A0ABV5B9Y7_9BACL
MKYKVTDTYVYVLNYPDVLCFPRPAKDYEDLQELVNNCETYQIAHPDDFEAFDHNEVTTPLAGGKFYTQDSLSPVLKLVNENKR